MVSKTVVEMTPPNVFMEVDAAARYLTEMARKILRAQQMDVMYASMVEQMTRAYSNHWHPQYPEQGSAFRAISCLPGKPCPMLVKAARDCGASLSVLLAVLPKEFVVWVNPGDVAVRIGEHGRIWALDGNFPTEQDVASGTRWQPRWNQQEVQSGEETWSSSDPSSGGEMWGDGAESTPERLRMGSTPSRGRTGGWANSPMHTIQRHQIGSPYGTPVPLQL